MGRNPYYEVPEDAWLFRPAADKRPDADRNWTPAEERVRQWCLHELIRSYGVDIRDIKIEYPVRVGTRTHRADIVVTLGNRPFVVVECKARGSAKHDEAMEQSISYATAQEISAEFAVYTNGEEWWVRRRMNGKWIPVGDLPSFSAGKAGHAWRDVLLAIDRLSPVMFWLGRTVPEKEAPFYFGALQQFFHSPNEITGPADKHLLWAADNLLRVLCDMEHHPDYMCGKLGEACKGLQEYWAERGVQTHFEGDADLWETAKETYAELAVLREDGDGPIGLDGELVRVLVALLQYLNRLGGGHRARYMDVDATVKSQVEKFIDHALAVRFNARLPDPLDEIYIRDIRDFCRPAWERYMVTP